MCVSLVRCRTKYSRVERRQLHNHLRFPAMHGALFAYVGPETILPLTSVLAALGGVVLLLWSYVRRALAWCVQSVQRTKPQ
jgi:hypothetical protein